MVIKELLNPIGNNVVTWIFPTDNQWGIPVLPLNMAGKCGFTLVGKSVMENDEHQAFYILS
jgi:hypothetical protein